MIATAGTLFRQYRDCLKCKGCAFVPHSLYLCHTAALFGWTGRMVNDKSQYFLRYGRVIVAMKDFV